LIGLLAFFVVGMSACKQEKAAAPRHISTEKELPPPATVLATVEGTPISDLELQIAIEAMMDKKTIGKLTAEQRRKVLDSLVASRAIALASEKELTAADLEVVEKKVQAYREQLLVKQFLARHAPPQPVTQEMVRTYYEDHPEKFGAKTLRRFELISSTAVPSRADRNALVKALGAGGRQKDWQKWTRQLTGKGHEVTYHQGQVEASVLDTELQRLLKPLKRGEMSAVSFIAGKAHLARITDEDRLPPQPLEAVSAQIRKALLPIQLKAAVSRISADVLGRADVSYKNQAETDNDYDNDLASATEGSNS
jgi:hypothetical protein